MSKYTVYWSKNNYGEGPGSCEAGGCETYEEALAAAKKIVEDYVRGACKQGMSPQELLSSYRMFGEDPYIIPDDSEPKFSGWDYAEELCYQLCGQPVITAARLSRAIQIAVKAHARQEDKAGEPYILHPLRLMLKMKTMPERLVAVLHDIVEDSAWSLDSLRSDGFPEAIVKAVDCLTRRDEESYEAFIERLSANPLARVVKIADLEDNMNLDRITNPSEKDVARCEKYREALRFLRNL